ncbi:MAG: DNA-directed RNA polymerase subunit E'' [Nanoarchaeota archaeon]|nr:DNA-directed RNA polymerase subunit E'' [Nanoarchaeota archaeon]MCK5629882.1 DNA-directed RNA polymerase subunit E'' [Nanoarchaeota archaeon]
MAKKKACKRCKRLIEGNECPICKTSSFANSWQGRISILDANKSEIGRKVGLEEKGEYAIKTR